MKKWSVVALLIVGATILGATVLREPVAWAAQTVDARIIGPLDGNGNVKVHEQGTAKVSEQNVDANGNVKVHEQGTANVNITNTSLPAPSGRLILLGEAITLNLGESFESDFVDTSDCSQIQVLLEGNIGNIGSAVEHDNWIMRLRTSADGTHFTEWGPTVAQGNWVGGRLLTLSFTQVFVVNVEPRDLAVTEPVNAPKASLKLESRSPSTTRFDRILLYCIR